jgi:hypothetical protein
METQRKNATVASHYKTAKVITHAPDTITNLFLTPWSIDTATFVPNPRALKPGVSVEAIALQRRLTTTPYAATVEVLGNERIQRVTLIAIAAPETAHAMPYTAVAILGILQAMLKAWPRSQHWFSETLQTINRDRAKQMRLHTKQCGYYVEVYADKPQSQLRFMIELLHTAVASV